MNIVESIKKGEGKTIEFKVEFPSAEKIAKTIIAYANTAGGKLIIGVSDQGEIIGIGDIDITEQMDRVSNIMHDMIHPMVLPEIYSYTLSDKVLFVLEIYPSSIKPHFLKNQGKMDGTYIRVGATNKKADMEYIQELERQKMNISFDEDLWLDEGKSIDDQLSRILETHLKKSIELKDLENLKLIREVNGKKRYTNAAPILLGLFEHVQIKCARFKGDSMDIFIDQKEFTGNLFDQLEQTMKFLLTNIDLHGEVGKDFTTRIDSYEIRQKH